MSMDIHQAVEFLDNEWDSEGFLGQLRAGHFNVENARKFLRLLRDIEIGEEESVPKRMLSLFWYLPSFLEWQRERVKENGGDISVYSRFVTDTFKVLEDVLGVP